MQERVSYVATYKYDFYSKIGGEEGRVALFSLLAFMPVPGKDKFVSSLKMTGCLSY